MARAGFGKPGRFGRPLHVFLLTTMLATVGLLDRLAAESPSIEVRTESLHVRFDAMGGVPTSWRIIDPIYLRPTESTTEEELGIELIEPAAVSPLTLLFPNGSELEVFLRNALFEATRVESAENIELRLESPVSPEGIQLVRTYRFPKRGFAVGLNLALGNAGDRPITLAGDGRGPLLALGPGLGPASKRDAGLAGALYAYVKPVAFAGSEVKNIELDAESPSRELIEGGEEDALGWAGIHNRYFLMALVPGEENPSRLAGGVAWLDPSANAESDVEPEARIAVATGPVRMEPGSRETREYLLYAGPKVRSELKSVGVDLDRVLYLRLWNWLRWLCFGLLAVMKGIHAVAPNWGITIILLAVVVRLVLAPVAQKGIRAQAQFNAANARMRPHLTRVNREFAKDAARKHQETMKVYREHGVSMFSPFKGCLTLFIQIPIFIALFNVIGQAYELRGVGFLWIDDLAAPDRLFPLGFSLPILGDSFNLLPILMALTQVLSTNLAPPDGSDARQQRTQKWSMWAMALAFFLLFYNFPAGLIIYWTCANAGHMIQLHLWKADPTPARAG